MRHPSTIQRSGAAALLCLAAACRPPVGLDLGREEIAATFRGLHQPIYQVYSLGIDRDAIHDLLAASFAGDALTDEYVEHFTTLVNMAREATGIEVLKVDYESVEVLSVEGDRALVDADWSVGGIVSHQAHKHPRVNRYRALYTLARQADGGLRIVDTKMRHLERVRQVLRDGAFPLDELPKSSRGFFGIEDLLRSGVLDEPPEAATAEDDASPAPAPSAAEP